MEAAPLICPVCGELIVVWPDADGRTMVIPSHLDRVIPTTDCEASATVIAAWTETSTR